MDAGRWRRRWTGLPRRTRWVVAGLLVLLLTGAGVVRLAEQQRAQRVELAASVGLWSSSTSPTGGQVRFFVVVRNLGERPVAVTSVDGARGGLVLRMRTDGEQAVPAGAEVGIPLSVRLTCSPVQAAGRASLAADLGVRRADGAATTRRVDLDAAARVLDIAATLCGVRPDLRDHELSGPLLAARTVPDRHRCVDEGLDGRTP